MDPRSASIISGEHKRWPVAGQSFNQGVHTLDPACGDSILRPCPLRLVGINRESGAPALGTLQSHLMFIVHGAPAYTRRLECGSCWWHVPCSVDFRIRADIEGRNIPRDSWLSALHFRLWHGQNRSGEIRWLWGGTCNITPAPSSNGGPSNPNFLPHATSQTDFDVRCDIPCGQSSSFFIEARPSPSGASQGSSPVRLDMLIFCRDC